MDRGAEPTTERREDVAAKPDGRRNEDQQAGKPLEGVCDRAEEGTCDEAGGAIECERDEALARHRVVRAKNGREQAQWKRRSRAPSKASGRQRRDLEVPWA